MAIAQEVLNIVDDEDLQNKAKETGDYFMQEIKNLQKSFPLIADVRGHGLFIGFEFMEDDKPATSHAKYIKERMRDFGILMSTDGPDDNVIKIKPPLSFGKKEVDYTLEYLHKVLKEDFLKN